MAKKAALGKGIASLLKNNNVAIMSENKGKPSYEENSQAPKVHDKKEAKPTKSEKSVANVPLLVDIRLIKLNPYQPRKTFNEKNLEDLSSSIKENGVIQPLVVTQKDDNFELIAGERRLRASRMAGLSKVPVIVKKVTDREKLQMAIIENVQRADLNCVEEALAYQKLMDDFRLTQEEVAKKIGKDRSSIANFLRVLKLPREVLADLKRELLSFGHAKLLGSLKDEELIKRVALEVVNKKMSVRDLENHINSIKQKKKDPSSKNIFFDEKLDQLKQSLERRTGFHFQINTKKNGQGVIQLKYSNEAEFNDIYEYLMK